MQSLGSKPRPIHTQAECAPTQQLVSVDVDDPLQGAPPQLGVGLVQERVSVRVAYPQEEDQEVEAAHDDQPPLITIVNISRYICMHSSERETNSKGEQMRN